jgi:hypothetical protein
VTNIEAASFGAKGDGVADDTKALLAALEAACSSSTPGALHIPAGRYVLEAPLSPPAGFAGKVTISGDGDGATELIFAGPGDGISFNFGATKNPFLSLVSVSDLAIYANAADATGKGIASGRPIVVDYGTAAGTAPETNRGSSIRRVSIGVLLNGPWSQVLPGSGWTAGPRFNACCHLTIDDLVLYGAALLPPIPPAAGPGSGNAMRFSSCINCTVDNVYLSSWNQPILLDNAGAGLTDCQGLFFSKIRGVGMGSLFRMVGTPALFPNGLSAITLTDWMCDNGYSGVTYQGGVDLEAGSDIKISGGWAQASNGGPVLRINGCCGIKVSQNKLYAGIPGPVVLLTGGTADSFISDQNTIVGNETGVQVDAGSTGNKIDGNRITVFSASGKPIINNEPSTFIGNN